MSSDPTGSTVKLRATPKPSFRSVIGALLIMTAVMATTAAMAVAAQAASRTPPSTAPPEAAPIEGEPGEGGPTEGEPTEDGGSDEITPPCVPAPPPEVSYSVADTGESGESGQPAEPQPCQEESSPPATTTPPPAKVDAADDTIDVIQDRAIDPFDVTENDVITPALESIEVLTGAVPDGLTLWLNNSLEGWVIGTPTECGTFTVEYQITARSSGDGDGPMDRAAITINVSCASAPIPIEAIGDVLESTTGERLEVDVVQNDTLASAITHIELETGELPPGLSLWAGGWLTGTPSNAGDYTFTYQAFASGGSTSSGTIDLTIRQAEQ